MSNCGSGSGATRRQLVTVSLYTEKFVVMHCAYLTIKVIRVTVLLQNQIRGQVSLEFGSEAVETSIT